MWVYDTTYSQQCQYVLQIYNTSYLTSDIPVALVLSAILEKYHNGFLILGMI